MEEESSPFQCPYTVTVRRNPHRKARPTPSTTNPQLEAQNTKIKDTISSFPMSEILAMEIPQIDPPPPPPQSRTVASEHLKVFLRIRPLVTAKTGAKDHNSRQRNKNGWPQNPLVKNKEKSVKTKKNSEVCVVVNDSRSVTVSLPVALQESKRVKSEVYEGFSQVFTSDSMQNEVYEKMMKPLVDDFLKGKNGLLAALGPSGSGKTHTVFGTPREPGMVPLALQQIFKENGSNSKRSFYMSIFEIYSDRGKAERISDLSADGADLSMQQSTIKGLQELPISSAAQAESLIACSMLKRMTSMTNTNSQSSRSQCIINIQSSVNCDGGPDVEPNTAILTIVDLAGAEREKRTGNQGSRLLESNFINNTSMVFGQCLRSLLEHQNNPKKPLQKHFKNSLLTRYLRDYLEGKKRMTLILTVKPGEDDYSDTSYLLRQASPFMKIKFTTVEEPLMFHKKRHIEMLPRVEQPKKMKHSGRDTKVNEEGKSVGDEPPVLPKVNSCYVDSSRDRSHKIMQNFARALWNVLKQYKEKLMVAEREIQSLHKVLGNEKARYLELEMELVDFKSGCTCSRDYSAESTLVHVDAKFETLTINMKESEYHNFTTERGLRPGKDQDGVSEMNAINQKVPKCSTTTEGQNQELFSQGSECHNSTPESDSRPGKDQEIITEAEEIIRSLNCKASEWDGTLRKDQGAFTQTPMKESECHNSNPESDSTLGKDQDIIAETKENVFSLNCETSECDGTPKQDLDVFTQTPMKESECHNSTSESDSRLGKDQDIIAETEENVCSLNSEASESHGTPRQDLDVFTQESLDQSVQPEDVAFTQECDVDVLNNEARRISSIPLRNITAFGFENEPEKPKAHECHTTPRKCVSKPRQDQNVFSQESLDPSESPKGVSLTQQHSLDMPDSELRSSSSCKPLNSVKPKRRLLPASSMLLRDVTLGLEDEPEKPKGNRGVKKSGADDTKRTEGSISLLRLLQSNLHL